MRRARDEAAAPPDAGRQNRQAPRAEVHAGPKCRRQSGIPGNDESEPARPADAGEIDAKRPTAWLAVMAEHDTPNPTR